MCAFAVVMGCHIRKKHTPMSKMMPQSNPVVPLLHPNPTSKALLKDLNEGSKKMCASTLNGIDIRIIPKMLLPPTISRCVLHVRQSGAQSIGYPTDNVHFQAVCVRSVL